jgi:filamentous hemagglutinin
VPSTTEVKTGTGKLGRSAVGKTGIDDLYKVNKPGVDYVVVEYKFDSTGRSQAPSATPIY